MTLLFVYLGLTVLGDLAAYFLGLFVERQWGSAASLWVFLTLIFYSCGWPGLSPCG